MSSPSSVFKADGDDPGKDGKHALSYAYKHHKVSPWTCLLQHHICPDTQMVNVAKCLLQLGGL